MATRPTRNRQAPKKYGFDEFVDQPKAPAPKKTATKKPAAKKTTTKTAAPKKTPATKKTPAPKKKQPAKPKASRNGKTKAAATTEDDDDDDDNVLPGESNGDVEQPGTDNGRADNNKPSEEDEGDDEPQPPTKTRAKGKGKQKAPGPKKTKGGKGKEQPVAAEEDDYQEPAKDTEGNGDGDSQEPQTRPQEEEPTGPAEIAANEEPTQTRTPGDEALASGENEPSQQPPGQEDEDSDLGKPQNESTPNFRSNGPQTQQRPDDTPSAADGPEGTAGRVPASSPSGQQAPASDNQQGSKASSPLQRPGDNSFHTAHLNRPDTWSRVMDASFPGDTTSAGRTPGVNTTQRPRDIDDTGDLERPQLSPPPIITPQDNTAVQHTSVAQQVGQSSPTVQPMTSPSRQTGGSHPLQGIFDEAARLQRGPTSPQRPRQSQPQQPPARPTPEQPPADTTGDSTIAANDGYTSLFGQSEIPSHGRTGTPTAETNAPAAADANAGQDGEDENDRSLRQGPPDHEVPLSPDAQAILHEIQGRFDNPPVGDEGGDRDDLPGTSDDLGPAQESYAEAADVRLDRAVTKAAEGALESTQPVSSEQPVRSQPATQHGEEAGTLAGLNEETGNQPDSGAAVEETKQDDGPNQEDSDAADDGFDTSFMNEMNAQLNRKPREGDAPQGPTPAQQEAPISSNAANANESNTQPATQPDAMGPSITEAASTPPTVTQSASSQAHQPPAQKRPTLKRPAPREPSSETTTTRPSALPLDSPAALSSGPIDRAPQSASTLAHDEGQVRLRNSDMRWQERSESPASHALHERQRAGAQQRREHEERQRKRQRTESPAGDARSAQALPQTIQEPQVQRQPDASQGDMRPPGPTVTQDDFSVLYQDETGMSLNDTTVQEDEASAVPSNQAASEQGMSMEELLQKEKERLSKTTTKPSKEARQREKAEREGSPEVDGEEKEPDSDDPALGEEYEDRDFYEQD